MNQQQFLKVLSSEQVTDYVIGAAIKQAEALKAWYEETAEWVEEYGFGEVGDPVELSQADINLYEAAKELHDLAERRKEAVPPEEEDGASGDDDAGATQAEQADSAPSSHRFRVGNTVVIKESTGATEKRGQEGKVIEQMTSPFGGAGYMVQFSDGSFGPYGEVEVTGPNQESSRFKVGDRVVVREGSYKGESSRVVMLGENGLVYIALRGYPMGFVERELKKVDA